MGLNGVIGQEASFPYPFVSFATFVKLLAYIRLQQICLGA